MKISDETTNLLLEVNDFSGDFIKHNYEVSIIVEASYTENDKKKFGKLIFTAKYLQGLISVLSRKAIAAQHESAEERIENEFKMNLEKFIKLLEGIIAKTDAGIKKYFEENYFTLKEDSLSNIMSLIDDLALIKRFFNAKYPEDRLS